MLADWWTLPLQIVVGLAFATAGWVKLTQPAATLSAVEQLTHFPLPVAKPLALGVPWGELGLGVALLSGGEPRVFGLLAAAVLAIFAGAMARATLTGIPTDCGCFGSLIPAQRPRISLMRNVLLLGAAAVLAAAPRNPAGQSVHNAIVDTSVQGLTLAVATLALVAGMAMLLVRESTRLLAGLAALREEASREEAR